MNKKCKTFIFEKFEKKIFWKKMPPRMPLPSLNASLNPKGERGLPEAALKRVVKNCRESFSLKGKKLKKV